MLGGADPGTRGSLREIVLIKARQRQNLIEHTRFLLQLKVTQLTEKSTQDEINKYNDLVEEYFQLLEPSYEQVKKKTYEDKGKLFEKFKTDFKLQKIQGKMKNFSKAN